MRLVHLSDIHVWRYSWDPRRLAGVRALGMVELMLGRARRFQLARLESVVDRVRGLAPDHVVITGDLTTTALPAEFREVRRLLEPILTEPAKVSIVPGNHDRTTRRSVESRRFEGYFGDLMPLAAFPWVRLLADDTAILGLDPTRSDFSAQGWMPPEQLHEASGMLADLGVKVKRLLVACHYPVAAPVRYQRELFHKRISNDEAVSAWLSDLGPHVYLCGHVHAAWAFHPPSLPNQINLNAGAPLMLDPTGLRLPGFLEITLEADLVTAVHHAWTGTDWSLVPILPSVSLSGLGAVPVPA